MFKETAFVCFFGIARDRWASVSVVGIPVFSGCRPFSLESSVSSLRIGCSPDKEERVLRVSVGRVLALDSNPKKRRSFYCRRGRAVFVRSQTQTCVQIDVKKKRREWVDGIFIAKTAFCFSFLTILSRRSLEQRFHSVSDSDCAFGLFHFIVFH